MQFNVIAGYTHFHFASVPELVQRWIDTCLVYKSRRNPE
jgi:cobyrinic acid a,c-diamide synthase